MKVPPAKDYLQITTGNADDGFSPKVYPTKGMPIPYPCSSNISKQQTFRRLLLN
jgi:hypothetical protein